MNRARRIAGVLAIVGLIAGTVVWRRGRGDSDGSPSRPPLPVASPPAPIPAPKPQASGERVDPPDLAPARSTVDVAKGPAPAPPGGEARHLVLLARDADTKSPLPAAQAWILGEMGGRFDEHRIVVPDPAWLTQGPFDADAEGCIRLPAGRDDLAIAVRAPGRAWSLMRIPARLGHVPVDLVPGGAVRLRIENWKELEERKVFTGPVEETATGPDEDLQGTSTPAEEDGLAWEPVPEPGEDGVALVEGLPCGPRRFEVRRGDWWGDGDTYGAATCVVLAGQTIELTVRATPASAGDKLALVGALVVPEEWGPLGDGDLELIGIRGLDRTNASVSLYLKPTRIESGRTLEFRGDPVPPGRYRIEAGQFGWGEEFVVSAGTPPPRWTIPAPATIHLRIQDAFSGAPIVSAGLRAHGALGIFPMNTRPDRGAGPGAFSIRLPPGHWEINCGATGYEESAMSLEVAGPTEIHRTVALRPGAWVEVAVQFEGAPWKGSVEVEIMRGEEESDPLDVPRDAGEVVTRLLSESTSTTKGSVTFDGIPPGTWKVSIGDLAGFERVEPRTVQLERGGRVEVVFDLQPKK